MIKLGIIEDNEEIVQSLRDYFLHDEDIQITGTAMYVKAFIRQSSEVPDIILLDLMLPHRNGMDCIPDLTAHYPGVSFLRHSVSADYDSIFTCLCNGAHSYLTKGESLSKIRETIISTYQGGSQMSVQIARKVVAYFSKQNTREETSGAAKLNSREMEVVNHILEGKSYKMTADIMQLSINTVRSYIKSIYKKLNINSNLELAKIYLKNSK